MDRQRDPPVDVVPWQLDELFRAFMDHAPAIALVKDEAGRYVYVNATFERVFGRPRAELVGRTAFDLFPPEVATRLREDDLKVFRERRPIELMEDVPIADGSTRHFQMIKFPLDPESAGFLAGIGIDVTDRLRAEQGLIRASARLEMLHEIDRAILNAESFDEMMTTALRNVRRLVPCRRASIIVVDADRRGARRVAVDADEGFAAPGPSPVAVGALWPNDGSVPGVRRIDDLAAMANLRPEVAELARSGLRSLVRAALVVGDSLIGELELASDETASFSAIDEDVLRQVADQLAVAIRQLQLHEEVERHAEELERTIEALRAADEQRRDLLVRLLRAQEEERRRVAGEIHDDPLQKMTAMAMRLDLLRRSLTDPDQLAALSDVIEVTHTTIDRLRHLLFALHPSVLEEGGLAAAVRVLLDDLQREVGTEGRLRNELRAEPPNHVRTIAYRIVQEALTNVRKHARARAVEVVLEERDGGLGVVVADDGRGFDVDSTTAREPSEVEPHLGLASMRERAETAGGTLTLRSEPGRGTTVELWLPV
ncbi:MAG TPA: PAS domain-containing protein [Actinomycetota bacterium]|nr:PAS domain-containing protein [Actinomycetota bacterium]